MSKWLGSIRGHRFSTAFHLVTLVHHLVILYYLNFVMDNAIHQHIHQYQYLRNMAQFSMRFFTSWNFLMQCYYFTLCLAHDLLQMTDPDILLTAKSNVVHLRNYVFRTFAFPMSLTVTLMFWGLFSLDRSFVFPPEVDLVMPSWVNHAMHTNIAILVLVEIATTCHGYSCSGARRTALLGITAISGLYVFLYVGTYFQHGVWLYPVYELLSWSQRFLLMGLTYLLTVGLYLCGEGLSSKIWENKTVDLHAENRKIK